MACPTRLDVAVATPVFRPTSVSLSFPARFRSVPSRRGAKEQSNAKSLEQSASVGRYELVYGYGFRSANKANLMRRD